MCILIVYDILLVRSQSCYLCVFVFFSFLFFKQKTAYEMRISDWSSDECSSDLDRKLGHPISPSAGCGEGKKPVGREISPGSPREEIGRASCRERVCQYV